MNFTKPRQVVDLGARNGQSVRQVQIAVPRADGRGVEYRIERLPWGRYMKVVKPNGSVERIPLHNGSAGSATDDPYKIDREVRKPRRGAIPFGRCLQTLAPDVLEGFLPPKWFGPGVRNVPESLLGRPACRTAADGHPVVNADHPCTCILELIELRKAANVERMTMIETHSAADRQASAAEGMVEAVAGLAQVVKDMQSKTAPKGGKGNGE